MKIIHTADWHLGRYLGGFSLLEEQKACLDQLLEAISRIKPDLILVAGDIFDRPIPPVEALSVYEDFLLKISKLRIQTVIIPGNHDQAMRLGFGSSFLSERKIEVRWDLARAFEPIRFLTKSDEFLIFACPFPEPSSARHAWNQEDIRSQQDIYDYYCNRIRDEYPFDRKILVAHPFVDGGAGSDSERLLTVGGSERVSAATFEGFDYVALGHLHRPQESGSAEINYSGSLFPYSFSEEDHKKGFLSISLKGSKTVKEFHEFQQSRKLRTVRGKFDDILQQALQDERKDDYVRVILEDEGLLLDVHQKLSKYYPRLIEINRKRFDKHIDVSEPGERKLVSMAEHFASFFHHVRGQDLDDKDAELLEELIGSGGFENNSDGGMQK